MKKRKGFTLAEILITMGIIGVVAALAAPSLVTSSNNAKIGPQLQKAVSTFETAAEMLLHDEDASGLVGVVGNYAHASYDLGRVLSKYMKIDVNHDNARATIHYHGYNGNRDIFITNSFPHISNFRSDDGSMYIIHMQTKSIPNSMYPDTPNNQCIGNVYIDVNGESEPNKVGKDFFSFFLYNDGTLRPHGSKSGYNRTYPNAPHWETPTHSCNANSVQLDGWTCAGSIFDNNMKIIYR